MYRCTVEREERKLVQRSRHRDVRATRVGRLGEIMFPILAVWQRWEVQRAVARAHVGDRRREHCGPEHVGILDFPAFRVLWKVKAVRV